MRRTRPETVAEKTGGTCVCGGEITEGESIVHDGTRWIHVACEPETQPLPPGLAIPGDDFAACLRERDEMRKWGGQQKAKLQAAEKELHDAHVQHQAWYERCTKYEESLERREKNIRDALSALHRAVEHQKVAQRLLECDVPTDVVRAVLEAAPVVADEDVRAHLDQAHAFVAIDDARIDELAAEAWEASDTP